MPGLTHWREPLLHVWVKESTRTAVFVLLGQGIPRLRTLGCGPLQNIAVLPLSAREIMHYNRELSCWLSFIRPEAWKMLHQGKCAIQCHRITHPCGSLWIQPGYFITFSADILQWDAHHHRFLPPVHTHTHSRHCNSLLKGHLGTIFLSNTPRFIGLLFYMALCHIFSLKAGKTNFKKQTQCHLRRKETQLKYKQMMAMQEDKWNFVCVSGW